MSTLKKLPSLSVITVTYQDPQGLKSTLNSLSKLEGLEWEWIVVDSSPETALPELSLTQRPLKHVITPPKGIYPAMNAGLKQATKECVWFLNGGDKLSSSEELKRLLAIFSKQDIDFVVGEASLYREEKFLYTHRNLSGGFLSNMIGANRICHQSVLYRRALFEEVGFFSEKYKLASDYHHHWLLYLNRKKGIFSRHIPVQYDMGGASKSYRDVFKEYALIHRDLSDKLPKPVSTMNSLIRPLARGRVELLKTLKQTPLRKVLAPLWFAYKRRGVR